MLTSSFLKLSKFLNFEVRMWYLFVKQRLLTADSPLYGVILSMMRHNSLKCVLFFFNSQPFLQYLDLKVPSVSSMYENLSPFVCCFVDDNGLQEVTSQRAARFILCVSFSIFVFIVLSFKFLQDNWVWLSERHSYACGAAFRQFYRIFVEWWVEP